MEIGYYMRSVLMKTLPVRFIERIRIDLALKRNNSPILVLQMGKVGSSSIYDGLRLSRFQNPVYHIHHISLDKIVSSEKYYRSRNTYIRHHLIVSKIISEQYFAGNIPFVYIVTAIREPIARRISSFFENFPQVNPDLLNYIGADFEHKAVEILMGIFRDEATEIKNFADSWFHNEIYEPFGLDVFSKPYDHTQGFHLLDNNKAKIVLFKIESLTDNFSRGIEALVGKQASLGTRNISTHKYYSESYQSVKKRLKLKESIVREILSSKVVEFFYANEKEALIRKWSA